MTPGHYFDPDPATTSAPRVIHLALPDLTVALTTDRGVFSGDRVDPGTKLLLLESPPPPPAGDLLDLGCGYGPVAVTLARRTPGATVWALDVNRRARELTVANAAAAGVTNIRVVAPAELPPEVAFSGLWSNPPVRIGKLALHDLLTTWVGRLAPGGTAHLVVHKHLGADSLAAWMTGAQGWVVTRQVSRSGYRVLAVRPAPGPAAGGAPGSPG